MKRALSLCVVLLLLIAGCTAIAPVGGPSVTHEVIAYNHHNSAAILSVQIQGEEGTVLDTSQELKPGDKWNVTTQDQPGEYSISVSTESGLEATAEYSLPLTEEGLTSFARITITNSGELDIRVYYQE